MMNKIFSIVLALVFMNPSFASYLDDWTNDDLCGWMNSATAPEHIQKEVDKRVIICFGGAEVSSLPDAENYSSENGTVFPSPDPSQIIEAQSDEEDGHSY